MFTSTGSSGLYKAPLSKSLLLVPSALSLLLTLLLPHCQKLFAYDLHAVKNDFQVWRLICGRIVCLDLKDTFCSSLLIYNFRIFERRYGSRKFASFLLGSWVLSALFDLILVEAVQYLVGVTVANNLPSGLRSPLSRLMGSTAPDLLLGLHCLVDWVSVPSLAAEERHAHWNRDLLWCVVLADESSLSTDKTSSKTEQSEERHLVSNRPERRLMGGGEDEDGK